MSLSLVPSPSGVVDGPGVGFLEVGIPLPQLLHLSPVHLLQLRVEALGLVSLVLLMVLLGVTLNLNSLLDAECSLPHSSHPKAELVCWLPSVPVAPSDAVLPGVSGPLDRMVGSVPGLTAELSLGEI